MTPVFIVQQTNIEAHDEVHNTLDNRWSEFFNNANICPICLPNQPDLVIKMLESNIARAAILTGGGEFSHQLSDKRSQVERLVMAWAENNNYPIIGVCRGMQSMMLYKDALLSPCKGQVSQQQQITFRNELIEVNSFHNFECINLSPEFEIIGTGHDGVIKAVIGKQLPWLAIMWHPERLVPQRSQDFELFNHFLKQDNACKD